MLEQERKYFEDHYAEWLVQHRGIFVMIKNTSSIGFFNTPQDGLTEGARLFGSDSFLIRRIEDAEQLGYIPALTLGSCIPILNIPLSAQTEIHDNQN